MITTVILHRKHPMVLLSTALPVIQRQFLLKKIISFLYRRQSLTVPSVQHVLQHTHRDTCPAYAGKLLKAYWYMERGKNLKY